MLEIQLSWNQNFSFCVCCGLTFSGCKTPAHLLSHSSFSKGLRENKMKKLLDWDKDRYIILKLPSQAKHTWHMEINLIYSHLKIDWWETKMEPKISFPSPPPFSKEQLQSFTPNSVPYPFPKKHRRIGNRGLQSVHNSSSLLLLPPHTLPLLLSEVTHTSRPPGNKHWIQHGIFHGQ